MLIGISATRSIVHMMQADDILDAYPGGYGIRVLIAPLFLLVAELFLWFKLFRRARAPARIFAGIVGVYILLMIVLANGLAAELYGSTLSAMLLWLYAYSSIGHLAYAYFGHENKT